MWRARGGSMAGAIRDGTVVRLVPPTTDVVVGDVVMAALPDDRLVIHRVTHAHDGCVRLRGDSSLRADPIVQRSAVIAVVEPTPRASLRARICQLVTS
jgi:hypothetical protein